MKSCDVKGLADMVHDKYYQSLARQAQISLINLFDGTDPDETVFDGQNDLAPQNNNQSGAILGTNASESGSAAARTPNRKKMSKLTTPAAGQ